jgi:hypothetical protein
MLNFDRLSSFVKFYPGKLIVNRGLIVFLRMNMEEIWANKQRRTQIKVNQNLIYCFNISWMWNEVKEFIYC